MLIGLTIIGVGVACAIAQCCAYVHGYERGYEFARGLVGKDKLPPYNKLHEELP